jgi:hypothetical protein
MWPCASIALTASATSQLLVPGHAGPVFHRRCFKCATCDKDFALIAGPPDLQRSADGRYHCFSHSLATDWVRSRVTVCVCV